MNRISSIQLPVWVTNVFWGVKQVVIAACVIAAGILLAHLINSPNVGLTLSIIGIVVHLLIILVNPLNGLLFWFIFYPFSERVVNIPLPAGIPDLSPTRFVIMFLSIMILGQVAIRKRTWPRLTRIDFAILSYMIAIIISTLKSSDPLVGIQFVLDNFLVPLIFYFLLKNLILNKRDLDKVLLSLLVISTYAALNVVLEQITGYVFNFGPPPDHIIYVRYVYVSYTDSLRLAQLPLFGSVDGVGPVLTLVLPFAFYYLFKSSLLVKKICYVLVITLILLAIVYTYKRTTLFSVPISFLIIQFFYPQFRRIFFIILIVFGVVLAVSWNQISQSALVTERIEGSKLESANGRTDLWEVTIDLWKERPVFGWGFRQTEKITRRGTSESFFLMLLGSTGISGFIPYVLMFVFILSGSISLYRQIGANPRLFADRELIAVFGGAFAIYILHLSQSNSAHLIANAIFMVLVGAIVGSQEAVLYKKEEELSAPSL